MLGVGVQRQVVGHQADVAVEQELQAALGAQVDRARPAAPQQAVVDEDQIGPDLARADEELGARAHAGHDRLDVCPTGYLEAVRAVVVEATGFQELVEVGDDVVAGSHVGGR